MTNRLFVNPQSESKVKHTLKISRFFPFFIFYVHVNPNFISVIFCIIVNAKSIFKKLQFFFRNLCRIIYHRILFVFIIVKKLCTLTYVYFEK